MTDQIAYQEYIQRRYNAFCKTVIRCAALDKILKLKRQWERQVSLAFEELTPTLLREMIEKIVVHECSYDENGTRRQDIEIYYSFVGKIDLPE